MLVSFWCIVYLVFCCDGAGAGNCARYAFSNTLLKVNKLILPRYDLFVGRKPKHPRDSYGAWLYHLRTEIGLTQQTLSDLTGIKQRTIAHWERTGKLAGRKEIFALAKALKVSISELLREKRQPDNQKKALKR